MSKIYREELNGAQYNIKYENIVLGMAELDVDGYYHFYDNKELDGFVDAWVLRGIADQLDELNAKWDEQVKNDLSI